MSTRVMAYCWPLKMGAAAKAVLISLADQANDDGVCWPSVGTIAERTCLDDRTIQRALAWLEQGGYLSREHRAGHSTRYIVNVRQTDTPVTVTPRHRDTPVTVTPQPPSQCHPAPVTLTGDPRHSDTQNRNRTTKESKRGALTLPEWLPAEAWNDWHEHRSAGKGWTPKARELSLRTLAELREAGNDPRRVIEQSIERGWTGLFPVKGKPLQADNPFAGAL